MSQPHLSARAITGHTSPPFTVLETDRYGVWRMVNGTLVRLAGEDATINSEWGEEPNNPVLSPDGTKVVFNWNFPGPNGEGQIALVNSTAAGQTPTILSPDDAGGPYMLHPQWHPDSDRVVYVHAAPAKGFYGSVVAVDLASPGTEDVLYTPSTVGAPNGYGPLRPQYSPDGGMILFFLDDQSGATDTLSGLYVMDADGSNVTQLDTWSTVGPPNDGYGFNGSQSCWTADGRIVYVTDSFAGGIGQVYIIDADGSGQTLLSSDGTSSTKECRINRLSYISSGGGYVIGSSYVFDATLAQNIWRPWRWELDGSGGTMLTSVGDPDVFAYDMQYFTNMYPYLNRIWFTPRAGSAGPIGWLSSCALDASDYTTDVQLDTDCNGDKFYAGTGIEWA